MKRKKAMVTQEHSVTPTGAETPVPTQGKSTTLVTVAKADAGAQKGITTAGFQILTTGVRTGARGWSVVLAGAGTGDVKGTVAP